MIQKREKISRREFFRRTVPVAAGFLLFGCGKRENRPIANLASATPTLAPSKTPEVPTSTPTKTQTPRPAETPVPTETPELKTEITVEKVVVGETGKKNPITAEYYSQAKKPAGTVLILGGTDPGENDGWLTDDQSQEGYLTKVKKWLYENKKEWEEFGVVLADINPDGEGRETPGRDALGRNFGGDECPVCSWHKTDWRTRKVTDPSGDSPLSSPEARATVNLAKIFQKRDKVLFAVFLHGEIPPKGLLDPGYCRETGNPLSCQISQKMAELSGAVYSEVFPLKYYGDPSYPSGIAGLPPDYFSVALNIPSACFELPDKKPSDKNSDKNIDIFCRSLFGAIKTQYSI